MYVDNPGKPARLAQMLGKRSAKRLETDVIAGEPIELERALDDRRCGARPSSPTAEVQVDERCARTTVQASDGGRAADRHMIRDHGVAQPIIWKRPNVSRHGNHHMPKDRRKSCNG